jgi:hypothetical protein
LSYADLSILENLKIDDFNTLRNLLTNLTNELKVHLNLDLINYNVKIDVIKNTTLFRNIEPELFYNGVKRSLKKKAYHVKLLESYKKFFPFFLLETAYLTFVPDHLKQTKFVKFAINQFVELDLQNHNIVDEWKLFTRERGINDDFRFDKFLGMERKGFTVKPIQFFFEYIRRYKDLDLDDDMEYHLDKMYKDFITKAKIGFRNDDIVETLRILTKIFYKVKCCDSLKGFLNHFNNFKKQGLLRTNLSQRKFKINLQWLNKFSKVAPTYYFDWKRFNIAIIPCYFKFNPLLEKNKINLVTAKMPFLIMPKFSINNFATEVSGYFVIPEKYIKDLKSLIKSLEEYGFLSERHIALAKNYEYFINLNYFRGFHEDGQIINPNNSNYSKSYEMVFRQDYGDFKKANISLLDFLILERMRFFSNVGVSFARSREIPTVVKSDLTTFFSKEKNIIKQLEKSLSLLKKNPNLKRKFVRFLRNNHNLGFFFILDKLEKWKVLFNLIDKESKNRFKSINQIKEFFKSKMVMNFIEKEDYYKKLNSSSFNFKNIFLKFLNNKDIYYREVKRIYFFFQFLNLCSNLKILNLMVIERIISNLEILEQIIKKKKMRLKILKDKNKPQEVSNNLINNKLENFSIKEPNLIKPYLVNTIWAKSIANYFPQIILKNNFNVKKIILKIRNFFPKSYYYESKDLFSNQELIFLQIFIPHLIEQEKKILISNLCHVLKDNIVAVKRYPWNGLIKSFSRKEFYDFYNGDFFYNDDLFKQFLTYVKKIFEKKLESFKPKSKRINGIHNSHKNFNALIRKIRKRLRSENFHHNQVNLHSLIDFHNNFNDYCLKRIKLEKKLRENYYKIYVKSFKIFPIFQHFGLEQFFLYITPFDLNDVDFKLLFANTFQKIHRLASIETTNSFLIQYIFPYDDPNTSYLNWLRSKNKIQEYCLFAIKSFNQIFHFNHSLTSNGWYLDSNSFKIYTQNILSNHNYKVKETHKKSFKVDNLSISNYHGPNSSYFEALMDLYNRETIDIKRNLNLSNYSVLEKIQNLMNRKLIFPYITFRNLDLKEKIHMMVFNLKGDSIEIIKKVFQYFNLVYLFEIDGEYYIHGLDEPQKIRNGLMIKLYLPDCELAEILRILEYVFQYLEVERYLIIPDLVDGESFLKTVYGDISFLEDYNPLNNLIWNERTKTWKNHTLFTQNFEYLYPDLNYQQDNQ